MQYGRNDDMQMHAERMGRWFGDHPSLIHRNDGTVMVPSALSLQVVVSVPVNRMTDEHLERSIYGKSCYGKDKTLMRAAVADFCRDIEERFTHDTSHVIGFENLPRSRPWEDKHECNFEC